MFIVVVGVVIWILISGAILVDGIRNRCATLGDKALFVALWGW